MPRLIIGRRKDQSFTVGEATITILGVKLDKQSHQNVRLAIEAPTHVIIERDDCKNTERRT